MMRSTCAVSYLPAVRLAKSGASSGNPCVSNKQPYGFRSYATRQAIPEIYWPWEVLVVTEPAMGGISCH
jgi:hypothetical protein